MNTPNNSNPKYCFSKKKPLESISDNGVKSRLNIICKKKLKIVWEKRKKRLVEKCLISTSYCNFICNITAIKTRGYNVFTRN